MRMVLTTPLANLPMTPIPQQSMDFAEALKTALELTNLTRKRASQLMGVDDMVVTRWMRGERRPAEYACEGALRRLGCVVRSDGSVYKLVPKALPVVR